MVLGGSERYSLTHTYVVMVMVMNKLHAELMRCWFTYLCAALH